MSWGFGFCEVWEAGRSRGVLGSSEVGIEWRGVVLLGEEVCTFIEKKIRGKCDCCEVRWSMFFGKRGT